MNVWIDVGSKDEAELIAASLPGRAQAASCRGYGIVRLQARHEREVRALLPILAERVEQYGLRWARIRFGDEERTFRSVCRPPAPKERSPISRR